MRPIHGKWQCLPGSFDKCHALELFPSANVWGIPDLKPELGHPDWLAPYDDWRTAKLKGKPLTATGASGIHFFMDDYRFEPIWNNPGKRLAFLGADFVLTPDFSLYTDHPLAIQLWNTYRNRWVGAFWQAKGVRVIPTVSWADRTSYPFCFQGLPEQSVLAISTVGVMSDSIALELFCQGYLEMIQVCRPSQVLCYGEKFPEELRQAAPLKQFQPYQLMLRKLDQKDKPLPLAPDAYETLPANDPAAD